MKNLHIASKPDWQGTPRQDMNNFQRVAAATDGWVTVSNALDVASLVLTMSANKDIHNKKLWRPLVKLSLCGLIDIADGGIAELTKTKSPKGKFFDAGVDKFRNIFTPMALTSEKVLPKTIGYPIIASEVAITIGAGAAIANGKEEVVQASANGKKAKFELSMAVASHMLSKALEKSGRKELSKAALLGAGALYALSVVDAKKVAQDYAPRLFK